MEFQSILFDRPELSAGLDARAEPSCFHDLNLDQVVAWMTATRADYRLEPFLYTPLQDAEAVRYRQDALRDLERQPVFDAVAAFTRDMAEMRRHLTQAGKLSYTLQRQRWFLDAVEVYCAAVSSLAERLTALDLASRGFLGLRDYLTGYTSSDDFLSLASETESLQDQLDGVRYCVHIHGNRVRVTRYEGEVDYGAEVQETFAKFQQGDVDDYRVKFPAWPEMNHIEAQVLEFVARLHPETFGALDEFCTRRGSYLDGTVAAFDREVQFYVAYLELIEPLRAAGLRFSYPEVSASSRQVQAVGAFDLALAVKLAREGGTVVENDVRLEDAERAIVVTGPNQGGKTTFARMFGQLHYLASLGYPVPGAQTRLFLPDRVFTHFEREEDLQNLRGKLEDELVRVRDILQQATERSVLIMNESFTSTTLADAVFLGTEVMRRVLERGLLCICVTFVDELAALDERIVSMVSTVVPDNPALRTFRVVRKPADGLAYAAAIAEKYGLTRDRLQRRIAR